MSILIKIDPQEKLSASLLKRKDKPIFHRRPPPLDIAVSALYLDA